MRRSSDDDMAKLSETYTLRIPQRIKLMMDEFLSINDKHELNNEIRMLIAKKIHSAKFNPFEYLKDDDGRDDGR